MSDFPVDPSKISFTEIKKEYENYLASKPNAEQLSQFYLSSAGQTTIEIAAAYLAFLKYDSIVARRENYLPYAQTRGGIVAGGQTLGYSAFRGRNALLTITFTPSSSGVYPKFYNLGDVSGYGLILLEETVYNAGTPLTVQCVVGDILTDTLQATTDGASKFRFQEKRVSQDLRMYIGNDEVDVSDEILDLLENKFVIQSNAIGSIDALYLNDPSAQFNFISGSQINLQYIELRDLEFTASNVSLDETEGTLTNVEITQIFQSAESNESIRLNAPLQNETKFTIRGRNDYQKLLLLSSPDFIAAGGRDTAVAAVVEAFALKSDLSVLSQIEKDNLVVDISANRPFGVQPPIIIDPVPYFLDLSIEISIEAGVTGDPNALIRDILAPYEKQLSQPEEIQKIDFKVLEAQITALDIVQISRILVSPATWVLENSYRRGAHVVPVVSTGFIYEASEFVRYSGNTEPLWPDPIPLLPPQTGFLYGQTIQDNDLVWVSIEENTNLQEWQADKAYRVGEQVKVTGSGNTPAASFQVQSYKHSSGTSSLATTATATEQGVTFTADNSGAIGNGIALVFDGNDDLDTVVSQWNLNNPSNTVQYSGGNPTDVLTAVTVNLTGGNDAVDAEPAWPIPSDPPNVDERTFVDDNQILWLMVAKEGTPPAWSSNTEYEIGDSVIPTSIQTGQEEIMFQFVAFIGKSGDSEPTFPSSFGDEVLDNEVVWIARNTSDGPESPRENEYYLINETVVLS
jgi:hypothetical protein